MDRTPTPEQATQALRELSQRQQQVRHAPPPHVVSVLAGSALIVSGVVRDQWPGQGSVTSVILLGALLALLFVSRTRKGGAALGYRVTPDLSTHRLGLMVLNRRGCVVLIGMLAVVMLGTPLLTYYYETLWPNTSIGVGLAVILIVTMPWVYRSSRAQAPKADDVDGRRAGA